MTELSIGFSIVARAAIVGVTRAVREMVALLEPMSIRGTVIRNSPNSREDVLK